MIAHPQATPEQTRAVMVAYAAIRANAARQISEAAKRRAEHKDSE
jgi:hypothetical protein